MVARSRTLQLVAGLAIGDSKVVCVSRESGYDEPFLGGGFLWQTFNSLQEYCFGFSFAIFAIADRIFNS